jgi:hypothetical protein
MASYLTLPFRTAPVEGSLIPSIKKGLLSTDRIGLLGASVTQHPDFNKLIDFMMLEENKHVRMSIASVRHSGNMKGTCGLSLSERPWASIPTARST